MRIISGKLGGRVLQAPDNLPVRPTTDFAKTGLFNIIESRFKNSTSSCLDLCAGTGSISFEMASRGYKSITAIDLHPGCIKFIKETCTKLGISNLHTLRTDAILFLEKTIEKFDLIFVDPPFDLDIRSRIHQIIIERKILQENGILILEHNSAENYEQLEGFDFSRKYGNVTFSFFTNLEPNKLP